jgi:hypothetical protein
VKRFFWAGLMTFFVAGCGIFKPVTQPKTAVFWPPTTPDEWLTFYTDSLSQVVGFDGIWEEGTPQTGGLFGNIDFAPDSSFYITTIAAESCGAYCNTEWYSWLHHTDTHGILHRQPVPFYQLDSIIKLPNGAFLLLQSSWSRPASVLHLSCFHAHAFVMVDGVLQWLPIPYKGQNYFDACEENGIEKAPSYLRWNNAELRLEYQYGNNYAYSAGIDSSLVFEGYLQYQSGSFEKGPETVRFLKEQQQESD